MNKWMQSLLALLLGVTAGLAVLEFTLWDDGTRQRDGEHIETHALPAKAEVNEARRYDDGVQLPGGCYVNRPVAAEPGKRRRRGWWRRGPIRRLLAKIFGRG